MIINQAARFNFGFASNLILLVWCVFGGFLLHMFESLYFSMLIKPTYEKPVDTAQDVLDRGLTVISYPTAASKLEILKNSPSAVTRALAKMTVVPKVIFVVLKTFRSN